MPGSFTCFNIFYRNALHRRASTIHPSASYTELFLLMAHFSAIKPSHWSKELYQRHEHSLLPSSTHTYTKQGMRSLIGTKWNTALCGIFAAWEPRNPVSAEGMNMFRVWRCLNITAAVEFYPSQIPIVSFTNFHQWGILTRPKTCTQTQLMCSELLQTQFSVWFVCMHTDTHTQTQNLPWQNLMSRSFKAVSHSCPSAPTWRFSF